MSDLFGNHIVGFPMRWLIYEYGQLANLIYSLIIICRHQDTGVAFQSFEVKALVCMYSFSCFFSLEMG